MYTFLRNTISKLYNAVSTPVGATRDALTERLQSVRDITSLLYNMMMENMGYGQQERLKNIVEKEVEEEEQPAATKEEEEQQQESTAAQEQQQDDDVRYDTVAKIKLVCEGKRVKEFRVSKNLNRSNTKMIMANITSHIEMRVKVIYSFKLVIYRGNGEIKDIQQYSKTLDSAPAMFTSLKEIPEYIKACEQMRLDLDNKEVWSKAYLPDRRPTGARCNYKGKVVFKHVQRRLVASNEPLMGCGPLPDWSREKTL